MAIARGTKASGGINFVSGFVILSAEMNTDLNTIVSGVNNITIADTNVVAGANIDPSKVGDFADDDATYQITAQSAARADPVDYTILTTSLPTTVEGEIARTRNVFLEAGGYVISSAGSLIASQWYAMFGKGLLFPSCGMLWPTLLAAAPAGWVLADDGSIGNGTSGATTRANKDTRELYNLLWNGFADAICPVTGGRGASSTADFDASKPMFLPPFCGRVPGIAGTPRSTNRIDALTGTQGNVGTTPKVGTSSTVFFVQYDLTPTQISSFVGNRIRFTSGALNGTEQTISAYDGIKHEVTVGTAFGGTPAAGVTYVIYPATTTGFVLPYDKSPTKGNTLDGYTIELTGGTGSGQTRTILTYNNNMRLITTSVAWTTNPDHTTTYSIYKAVATRAVGDRVGTDLTLPTIDGMAGHRHPSVMVLGGSGIGHTLDSSVAGGNTSSDTTTDNAIPGAGAGSGFSLLQPTFFMRWIIKL